MSTTWLRAVIHGQYRTEAQLASTVERDQALVSARAGPYYDRYLTWLKGGLPRHEAYLERAGAHHKARAYLQARADAAAAVQAIDALQQVTPLAPARHCVLPRSLFRATLTLTLTIHLTQP